jgi:5'-phosphate synthase pdxT subunit
MWKEWLSVAGRSPLIGVLALQGCVRAHKKHIEALGAKYLEVRRPEDFLSLDGLILPGGESTTMIKLIEHFGIWDLLKKKAREIPYWGICAGTILMAKTVKNPAQKSLGIINIEVQRNAYGRQLQSHQSLLNNYGVSFIRAPVIKNLSKNVELLASHQDSPVWVREGKHRVATFHAELNPQTPSPFHKEFIESVCKNKKNAARSLNTLEP